MLPGLVIPDCVEPSGTILILSIESNIVIVDLCCFSWCLVEAALAANGPWATDVDVMIMKVVVNINIILLLLFYPMCFVHGHLEYHLKDYRFDEWVLKFI